MRRPPAVAGMAVVLGLLAAGCGDSGPDEVSAREWADRVCESAAGAQEDLAESPTDEEVMQQLEGRSEAEQLDLLRDVVRSRLSILDDYASGLRDAGVPEVEGADEWYEQVEAAADEAEQTKDELEERLDSEDVTPEELQQVVSEADGLRQELAAVGRIEFEGTQALAEAVQGSEACQSTDAPPAS